MALPAPEYIPNFGPGSGGFSLNGATPNQQPLSLGSFGGGTSPFSSALQSVKTNTSTTPTIQGGFNLGQTLSNFATPGQGFQSSSISSTPTSEIPSYGQAAVPFSQPPSPPTNQDVKSHTSPDGTVQTYYPSSTNSGASTGGSSGSSSTAPGQTTTQGNQASPQPATPSPLSTATTGLLNQPNSPYQSANQQAVGGLLNSQAVNNSLAQNAQNIASAAGASMSQVGQAGANGQAGYLTTGTSPVGEGNAAVLAQTTAAKQQAIAQGAQTALEGNQQALSAQGQAQSGLEGAGSTAIAGQGANTSALSAAGGLSSPVSQFGVLGTPQSVGAFGSNGNVGSAAFQGGYIGGQQAAGTTAANMQVANTTAKGIQGTIQQYLAANPHLNQSSSTLVNAAQQWLQGKQLGDPSYQTLFNYINEYVSTLAPILGVGGDTTNLKTEIAQSFVNAQASGQNISQVLNSIGSLADNKLANFISAGQGGGQVAGGQPTGTNPTSFGTEW